MMRSNPWFSMADHPVAARRAVDILFLVYYAGLAVTGLLTYLVEPSPSVWNALRVTGTHVWSIGTVAASTVAFVCRFRRATEAETIALTVLAALTFLHGLTVIIGTPGLQGIQTGARLMAAPAILFAVVGMLRHPVIRLPANIREDTQ